MNAVDDTAVSIRTRRIKIGFAVVGVLLIVHALLWWKIPQDNPLIVLPGLSVLLALAMPLFCWQTLADPKQAKKIAGIGSAVIWVLGIGLMFVIPTTSKYVYVSDGLLLLGFFPLLYLWRFSFPWLIFGALNIAIGVFLQMIELLPDSYFPPDLWKPKHHLSQYHPPMTWWLLGGVGFGFGAVRAAKNIYKMVARKMALRVKE